VFEAPLHGGAKMNIHPIPRKTSLSVLLASFAMVFACAATSSATGSKSELKCQLGTTLAIGKFIDAKAKCIDNCWKRVFKGSGDPADCGPPYAGSTFGCVNSNEAQASGDIHSSCVKECPSCYSGGDCSADADAKIADAEAHVEALAADVYCDDSASGDGLTLSEFKCQRTVRRGMARFDSRKLKCFAKCWKGEASGKLAGGSCEQPTSDPKTQICLDRLESKTAFLIDKKCESSVNPSADKPECGSYAARTGADWVAAEEAIIASWLPDYLCEDSTTTTTAAATTTITVP